jgi:predicted glycosyltransferase involved in capsule biosynthesis
MTKKLCIVVPYRDRESHLQEFAPWMKRTLEEQNVDYDMLIVEQETGKPFNRAKLLNVGFDYVKGLHDYYCFHDVDMLPIESDYSYCQNPTHLAARVEQFNWGLAYQEYFGGVTIFDRESFQKINGYANEYWGWGAEDDDVFNRCVMMKIQVSRKNCSYRSLNHDRKIDQEDYQLNLKKLQNFGANFENGRSKEGLDTLDYEILEESLSVGDSGTPMYKKITVKI